jgi:hypothetical protein
MENITNDISETCHGPVWHRVRNQTIRERLLGDAGKKNKHAKFMDGKIPKESRIAEKRLEIKYHEYRVSEPILVER